MNVLMAFRFVILESEVRAGTMGCSRRMIPLSLCVIVSCSRDKLSSSEEKYLADQIIHIKDKTYQTMEQVL